MSNSTCYRIAVAHTSPVLLELDRTINKACSVIEEAARYGARLIAFPEAFVPAFPLWSALRAPIYNHFDIFKLSVNRNAMPPSDID